MYPLFSSTRKCRYCKKDISLLNKNHDCISFSERYWQYSDEYNKNPRKVLQQLFDAFDMLTSTTIVYIPPNNSSSDG